MAGDDRLKGFGDVGDRVHIVELARRHDGSEQGPILGPDFMTGEERVFAREAHWPDGVFDRIGVEFETTVGGKYVNGVDIIRCDDAGRIVEFRVMIRPLQAVTMIHDQMRQTLERLSAGSSVRSPSSEMPRGRAERRPAT